MAWVYSSVAIFVASEIFRQSINQNLADTVVTKDTQSFTKVSGEEPVTSSQTARDWPPKNLDIFVSFSQINSTNKIIHI